MKFLLTLITIFYIISHQGSHQERFLFKPAHFLNSAKSVATGIGSQVLQNVFSPRDLIRASMQLLFGQPELAVFRTLHELCKFENILI